MKRDKPLRHEFVEYIPDRLDDGTVYVSVAFATAAHKCCCGCGKEVVTPLSPTDWKLTFDGVTISLSPSIGNWSFQCQSHYWITQNNVHWAGAWSEDFIEGGRERDRHAKGRYYEPTPPPTSDSANDQTAPLSTDKPNQSWWQSLRRWLSR